MKLSIFILDENSQSSMQSVTDGLSKLRSLKLTIMKILISVALMQEIKSFGYTSNDDVKERYHSCMMKGKYEKICDLICKKVSAISASDPGTESANKCYQCRGRQGSTYRSFSVPVSVCPMRHKPRQKYIFRWTGKARRVLFTKTFFA